MFMENGNIFTADRREGGIWIIEDENGNISEHTDLPEGTHEGAKLVFKDGAFELLPEDAENREEIKSRMNRLFKKR